MSTDRVEVIDVILNFLECVVEGLVSCDFQFGFDGSKARLHEGIVVAISGATHTPVSYTHLTLPTIYSV